MITLYWSPQSSAIRALWALEELQMQYELRHVDITQDPRDDPGDFLEASPIGKVPAIRDGGELLSGSAAICLYLADRYSGGRLAPLFDAPGRAQFLYWMFFTPVSVEPAMAEKFMGLQPNKVAAPWGTWDLMLQTLERGLEASEYIAGRMFSAADVMIAMSCSFLIRFKLVEPSAAMSNYLERCQSRPAYRRAVARDLPD